MTINEILETGLTIGRVIIKPNGVTYMRLDSDLSKACVLVRDQKDGDFFICGVFDHSTADKKLSQYTV